MTTHQLPDDDAERTQAIPSVTPQEDDDLLDPDWERPRSTNTLTLVLLALLILVLGFVAGVLTQRALTAPPGSAPAAAAASWPDERPGAGQSVGSSSVA